MSAAARSGAAFDAIAAEYDAVFSNSLIGRAQRQAVWETTDRIFLPGQHILEINCGTGVDAVHLAERGVGVHACDASPAMVSLARARAQSANAAVIVERRANEELAGLIGPYDGLLSNFGGLNCVREPSQLAREAHRLVRTSGSVVLCYMGPFCAWETAWYFAHLEPGKSVRRWKPGGVMAQVGGGEEFPVHYPKVRDLVRAFLPAFRLVEWKGIGVFVPPSYAETFAARHTSLLKLATRVDRAVATWPVFRGIADHVLLRFEKVRA